jgi:hypothetical protein
MGVDGIAVGLIGGAVCSLILAIGLGVFTFWYWRHS